jgi:serine/threonine protein kinase
MTDRSLQGSEPVGAPISGHRTLLPNGTRLDHYVIRGLLGQGGFAITYLAEHEVLGKKYAIKEYFPAAFSFRDGLTVRASQSGEDTYNWGLERFTSEARSLARFKHPAIVDVASIFEAHGTAYIVLAFEKGRSLSEWLRQAPRPPSQAEIDAIVRPLLSALEEVHKHNILHRDIAPDNIIIRDDGTPVLIDFGAAREAIQGRTRAMSAIVKHGYSPPEQYSSRPELQGPWTDIYALSATLYRAVTGRLTTEAPDRMLRDDLAPVAQLARGHYRPSFLDAIDQGLRLRTEERPQTVVEWRRLLMRDEPLKAPMATPRDAPAADPSHLPTSTRIRSGGSTSSSLRPDISVIEEIEAASRPEPVTQSRDPRGIRMIGKVLAGLGIGAFAGALFSILPASIFASSCFSDMCLLRYVPMSALIGAVVGTVIGYKLGSRPQPEAEHTGRSITPP